MTEPTKSRFDIEDPLSAKAIPADDVAVDEAEDAVEEIDEESDEAPATKRNKKVDDSNDDEDLSEYLDEVAGKRIAELTGEIAKLRKLVEERERTQPPSGTAAPAAKKNPPADDKVARRQSQFVSRASGREGSALSPVDRATRSVEELMRKRGLL
jgi:hypothetical protein